MSEIVYATPRTQTKVYATPRTQTKVYATPRTQTKVYATPRTQTKVYATPRTQTKVYATPRTQTKVYATSSSIFSSPAAADRVESPLSACVYTSGSRQVSTPHRARFPAPCEALAPTATSTTISSRQQAAGFWHPTK